MLFLVCYALLCVRSSFAILLKRKRKLVALLLLSYICIVTMYVMWLFLLVPCVVCWCVVVVFPGHTHLLFHDTLQECVSGQEEMSGTLWLLSIFSLQSYGPSICLFCVIFILVQPTSP